MFVVFDIGYYARGWHRGMCENIDVTDYPIVISFPKASEYLFKCER